MRTTKQSEAYDSFCNVLGSTTAAVAQIFSLIRGLPASVDPQLCKFGDAHVVAHIAGAFAALW